jgi:hypothetical protein
LSITHKGRAELASGQWPDHFQAEVFSDGG